MRARLRIGLGACLGKRRKNDTEVMVNAIVDIPDINLTMLERKLAHFKILSLLS